MKAWLQKYWWLLAVILVATILRFWNLPGTVQFGGDQGRDALTVARIFREGDLVFIGPVTSVGNMYLGPLYYYFMLPWLMLSYPSPLGPVYAIAALGVLTAAMTYWLGKSLISERAAAIASMITAASAIAVEYSRFSWNPNPAPFVSLIMIWGTWKAWQKNSRYWVLVALCFSVLVQLHYLALLSAAGAGVIWLLHLQQLRQQKRSLKPLLIATAVGAGVFLLSLTPLILFDIKHEGLNSKGFIQLFTKEEAFAENTDTIWTKSQTTILNLYGRSTQLLVKTVSNDHLLLAQFILLVITISLAWIWRTTPRTQRAGLTVLLVYLVTGVIGTAFYQHSIYNHYVAYLFPVVFLLYGLIMYRWWLHPQGKAITVALVVLVLHFNFTHYKLQTAGWTVEYMRQTAASIFERVRPGEKYNIVLLSETGDLDGQNYRYFLETTDHPPVRTEQRGEVTTLFIINEDRKLAKVVDSPVYEIVVFPNKQPREVFQAPNGGPEITILRTYD